MDKTLSQEEVDALLQAVKTGQVSNTEEEAPRAPVHEVKVVSYDFRKPHLMSGDQLRGFQMMHETFAKNVQAALLANIKTQIEVKQVAIDNITYGEFILSLVSPTFIVLLGTTPNMGELVLEVNMPVVMTLVDILLGGSGARAQEPRELTAIEQSIASTVLDSILSELHNAFAGTYEMTFKARSVESNPEYVQATIRESAVLVASFDVRIGETTGTMSICYPIEMIQPVLARVSARMTGRKERTTKSDAERQEMLRTMGGVPLKVRTEVGTSKILASQLGRLKPGDMLCLDKRIDGSVEVFVDQRCCFLGRLGTRRGKVAVKLTEYYSEEGEAPVPAAAAAVAAKPK